jgi:DNA-binding PadR family transcriptional regulator
MRTEVVVATPRTGPAGAPNLLDYQLSIYHDVSMSVTRKPVPAASLHLLLALLAGEQHGYALMQRVAELSDGAVRMGPGTLYGTINRLRDEGLIIETTDRTERHDGERRRYYELTDSGRTVALDELSRLRSLVERVHRALPGGATA